MRIRNILRCAFIVAALSGGVASMAHAQNHDSFHNMPVSATRGFSEKRVKGVAERMAGDMLDGLQRFKGARRDSALLLLAKQSKHHMIVLAQCDFELHLTRQNAHPAWQALSDSVARDTRRIVVRGERLNTAEINEVLNRAARMAQFCMDARSGW